MEEYYREQPKAELRGIEYQGNRYYELEELKEVIHFQHLNKLQVDSDSES